MAVRFNAPPNWPTPPQGWAPTNGWQPDSSWPAAPAGWPLWVDEAPQYGSAPSPQDPYGHPGPADSGSAFFARSGATAAEAGMLPARYQPYPVPSPAVYKPIRALPSRPIPGADPRLVPSIQEYLNRGYRLTANQGDAVTLTRQKTPINWIWVIGLAFLGVGIGSLVYLGLWQLWGIHKEYTVTLSVGTTSPVMEEGDGLGVYDHDRLVAQRLRGFVLGSILAAILVLWIAVWVSSLGSPDAQSDMVAFMVGYGFMAAVLGGGVYLFFTSAQKARRVLLTGA